MIRYTLYVPQAYNDGTPFPASALIDVEEIILGIAGGFTRTDSVGAWRDGDKIYREPISLYAVDSDDPEVPGKLHAFARVLRTSLDQEAIYLTHETIGATLISG
jgi:hypothetical protein